MFLILEQIIVVFYLRSYIKKCKTITLIDFKTKIKNQKDVYKWILNRSKADINFKAFTFAFFQKKVDG
jgi:hypothetical protein